MLWFALGDERIPVELRRRIEAGADIELSAVTAWEIAIKQASGKLADPMELSEFLRGGNFRRLPITFEHARVAGGLPPLHRDPFDRMLVAQAMVEGMTLVTSDRQMARYDVAVLWD